MSHHIAAARRGNARYTLLDHAAGEADRLAGAVEHAAGRYASGADITPELCAVAEALGALHCHLDEAAARATGGDPQ